MLLQNGWLSPFRIDCTTGEPDVYLAWSVGVIDFAGSAAVHVTGGAAALAGATILQPRQGRFSNTGQQLDMSAHNPVLQVLGTLILWLGWCVPCCSHGLGERGTYERGWDRARVDVHGCCCVCVGLSARDC